MPHLPSQQELSVSFLQSHGESVPVPFVVEAEDMLHAMVWKRREVLGITHLVLWHWRKEKPSVSHNV